MLGYSGEVVSCNNDGPVCICFDDSDENNPALVAFIGGKLAIHWADRTEGDMRNSVISHLADCLGSWVYQYTDVTIKNWAKKTINRAWLPEVSNIPLQQSLQQFSCR